MEGEAEIPSQSTLEAGPLSTYSADPVREWIKWASRLEINRKLSLSALGFWQTGVAI
jgi:hypothetical protein